MLIRDATSADLPVITAIYAHHVLVGTGTFEEEPPSEAEMAARVAKVQGAGWAWLVAELDGVVIGYAYFNQFRERSAYRFAAENSIYVRDDVRARASARPWSRSCWNAPRPAASGRCWR